MDGLRISEVQKEGKWGCFARGLLGKGARTENIGRSEFGVVELGFKMWRIRAGSGRCQRAAKGENQSGGGLAVISPKALQLSSTKCQQFDLDELVDE